jgi:hypothetical protein
VTSAPCATCPWRRSSTLGGYDIPGFGLDLMRGLSCTVSPRGRREDAFRVIMACHGSPEGGEDFCRGYLAREGWSNLSVRMHVFRGDLNLDAVDRACAGIDLWDNFYEMLDAYEEARDDG